MDNSTYKQIQQNCINVWDTEHAEKFTNLPTENQLQYLQEFLNPYIASVTRKATTRQSQITYCQSLVNVFKKHENIYSKFISTKEHTDHPKIFRGFTVEEKDIQFKKNVQKSKQYLLYKPKKALPFYYFKHVIFE
jgi:hypothetical protein